MAVVPRINSVTYKLCAFIYRNGGSVDAKTLRLYCENLLGKIEHSVVHRVTENDYAVLEGDMVKLMPKVIAYFDDCKGVPKYEGQIVQPRSINLMQQPEMKGYTAMLTRNLREPIREISFMSVASAPDGVWSYRQ